jgi:hypothetical protein
VQKGEKEGWCERRREGVVKLEAEEIKRGAERRDGMRGRAGIKKEDENEKRSERRKKRSGRRRRKRRRIKAVK